jgi:hypothetical protein
VCGLNKIISTRTTTILNSTNNSNKATSIPKKLITNSTDNKNINDNDNINGVDNVIQNGEDNYNINDNDNINRVDNDTTGEKNKEENRKKSSQGQEIITNSQKQQENTISKEKIHQGYICKSKYTNEDRTAKVNKVDKTLTKKMRKVTKNNLPFGHVGDNIAIDNDTPYIRVYCQNVCGKFDRDGIRLDSAFREIKQAGADIFTFNETHGDESNALARRVTRLSKQRMWKDNNKDCKIIDSSSTAPVLNFTKP